MGILDTQPFLGHPNIGPQMELQNQETMYFEAQDWSAQSGSTHLSPGLVLKTEKI